MTQSGDPYARNRAAFGVAPATIGDQDFTMLLRYEDVKAAALDWEHFSSATPFRVPIPEESDVRPVCASTPSRPTHPSTGPIAH